MQFEFASATRILFGPGTLGQVGTLAAEMGKCVLVVTGPGESRAAPLLKLLEAQGLTLARFTMAGEPTIQQVQVGVEQARQAGSQVVIGFGGGSVLDTGKTIAALLTNPGDPLDYLEVIGRGQALSTPSAPYIAIPTTAGTGAEVTRNAVLSSPEHQVKVSLRSPSMLPRLALVDPLLTHSLPPALTASTGLDALTQLIEPFVSNAPNPLTDALCREGIPRTARALPRAYEQGDNAHARQEMALASLLGGLALANARLGAVHGFAGPLGGMFPAPHGALCAALLPHVMATNVRALETRQPGSEPLSRYAEVARLLTSNPQASAQDGVRWIQNLCQQLQVPPLASYGMSEADIPAVVEKASVASSMKGNPLTLSVDELGGILEAALGMTNKT
ncbi:MAG: iron-containing alcohol dehydrogenase [Ardenticatenales bacterium]|nr:iron-containing alcohol dehydrogenase [Ardenticatenales bacterium]